MMTTGHCAITDVEFTRKHPEFDQEAKKWKMVEAVDKRLNVIDDYNRFMDEVDVADQLRTNYQIRIKSNKWWHPIFWSVINTAICNAHLLYKVGIADQATEVMYHSDFRAKLAQQLVQLFQRQHGPSSGKKRKASTQAAVERPPPPPQPHCRPAPHCPRDQRDSQDQAPTRLHALQGEGEEGGTQCV